MIPKKFAPCSVKQLVSSVALAVALGASAPAHALLVNLTSTGNAQADAGFRTAADIWESLLADSVTINIIAGFSALGTGILGQAGSSYFSSDFSSMKTALTADAKSASDSTMVAGLSTGSTYSKLINGTSQSGIIGGASYVRSDITNLRMTTANAKALGLVSATDAPQDATITFSSLFDFDFDSSDGIASGFFDFVGVAIHEIGHALGFTSGVDVLDINNRTTNTFQHFNDYEFDPFATVLDFTRCSSASEAAGADMDWTIGGVTRDFAINGSCSGAEKVSNAWSTGQFLGDGKQASHWKDNLSLGIMDPTFSRGEFGQISGLDLLALDVIGWDLKTKSTDVPEPGSLALFGLAIAALAAARRRRARA